MHHKLTRAAVAALTVVGLAACGTSGGSGAASEASHSSTSAASSTTSGTPSSSVPARSATSPSSSASSDAGFTKPAPGGSVDAVAFGHAVTKAIEAEKTYHLVMTSPSEKTAIEGDIRRGDSSRTDMSLMSPDGGIRIVDNSVYLSDPSGEMAGGKKWMVISKDSKSPFASMMFSAINSMLSSAGLQGGMDDTIYSSAKARFVGDESAGAHYTIVVGADKLLESSLSMARAMATGAGMPPAIVDQMKAEIDKQRAKVAGKTVRYDYWLDDKMRPIETDVDATALGAAGSDSSLTLSDRMTIKYSKWGESVTITAPPASETISIDKALGDAMGSAMPTDLPSGLATDLPSSAN